MNGSSTPGVKIVARFGKSRIELPIRFTAEISVMSDTCDWYKISIAVLIMLN
jgi:hypothetical protein